MIRMCKNKKIDLVITKSISRFARNTVDCLEGDLTVSQKLILKLRTERI